MSHKYKSFSIIAAIDDNFGIGNSNNEIPWQLKKDMNHFKNITTKTKDKNKINAVIMGKKTWDSIPEKFKPLPNRFNVILTSKNIESCYKFINTISFTNFDYALEFLTNKAEIDKIFVIGGSVLYNHTIKYIECEKLYITFVNNKYPCNVFFPDFLKNDDYKLKKNGKYYEENGIIFKFCVYKKSK